MKTIPHVTVYVLHNFEEKSGIECFKNCNYGNNETIFSKKIYRLLKICLIQNLRFENLVEKFLSVVKHGPIYSEPKCTDITIFLNGGPSTFLTF